MRTFFTDLWKQLVAIWQKLDGGQRLVVVAVLVGALVGLGGIVWYAGRPSYEEVFSTSDPTEMEEARRALSQAGVPFQPDSSGQSILVDRSLREKANQTIFAKGLRGGSASKSALEKGSIIEDSVTRTFRLDGQTRAQTEAAIRGLDGVVAVTVMSTKPKPSAFRDRDQETRPRASVTVKLRPGTAFEAVARAASSLAAAGLGMPVENVEVIDAVSKRRWSFDQNREAGGTGSSEFLAQQRSLGDERTKAAQQALDALWPGKTVVTVNVELDPNYELIRSKVVPETPIVITDKTTKDKSEAAKTTTAAGDPSAAAATNEPVAGSSSGPNTSKETREKKFVEDYGDRTTGKVAPEIKRLSVAVLYDKTLEAKANKDELAKTVKAIVGYDQKRDGDDAFSMLSGEFPAEEPLTTSSGPSLLDKVIAFAPTIAQLLGVLVVVLFLKGLFKRSPAAQQAAATAAAEATAKPTTPEERVREMRREIERSIANDPAALAKLLESWMAEQKT